MSSRTIQLSSLLYASSNTFLMTSHLALSEKPTMFSGEMTFTKGKLDSLAMYAARAVFPQPALPVVKGIGTFQMMPTTDKRCFTTKCTKCSQLGGELVLVVYFFVVQCLVAGPTVCHHCMHTYLVAAW